MTDKQYTKEIEGKTYFFLKHTSFSRNRIQKIELARETKQFIIDSHDNRYNKKTGMETKPSQWYTTYLLTHEEYVTQFNKEIEYLQDKKQSEIDKLYAEIKVKQSELHSLSDKFIKE